MKRFLLALVATMGFIITGPGPQANAQTTLGCTPLKDCACAGLGSLHAKVCLNDAFIMLLKSETEPYIDMKAIIENMKLCSILPPEITLQDMIDSVSSPELKTILESKR